MEYYNYIWNLAYYGFTLKELGLKYSEDLEGFLGSIITTDFYEKLVIIGFPHDKIIQKCGKEGLRIGSHYGPDSWRRFLHTTGTIDNREFGIKIENIRIADYGNIVHSSVSDSQVRNQVNFVMGGTRDYTPYVSKALMSHKPFDAKILEEKGDKKFNKCLIISFNHSFDIEDVEGDLLTPFNRYTYLYSTGEFTDSESDVLFIGPENTDSSLPDHFNCKSISEIKDSTFDSVEEFSIPILTKAAKCFYWIVREKRLNYNFIQVDFNIESICEVIGVTNRSPPAQYFQTEEAIEIMFICGYFNEIKSVNLSEYNPRIEDIKTGQLCAEMFYYFTLGVEFRERNSKEKFVKPEPKVVNVFTGGS